MWPIILLIIIVLFILFLSAMTLVYRTKPVHHQSTPLDSGISFEEEWFTTSRNLKLYAWWIPNKDQDEKNILILCHGWKRNVERMMPYIKELHQDYNLFVFDSRNHGHSDSDNFTSMPKYTEDILAAIDHLSQNRLAENTNIGLVGLSLGGSAALYAASKDQRIKSVVTVGAFANPRDVMRLEFKKRHIPYYPFVYLLFEYVQLRIGLRFDKFAPENNIQNALANLLFIHGTIDKTAPIEQADRLVAAAVLGKAELLKIEDAGHSNCHKFPGFWEKVRDFLKSALN